MSFKHIISRDNSVFKHLKRIAENARDRKREGVTLLDGVHLIEAYIQVFGEPELLIIPEGKSTHEATALVQQLQEVNTVMFPTLMFTELTPVATSTGILALAKVPELLLPEQISFALMVEDIQDPGNLGSILRTAAAAGVQVVYLSKGCTDAWSPKALRGGQGAQFVLPIVSDVDLAQVAQTFDGLSYALAMHGESLYQQNLNAASLFIVGNEGAGISSNLLVSASKVVSIPMAQSSALAVESLNVAAATAIALFECRRQKALI
ncbi:MAG: RNA methyltransferase [Methylophilus sp.]|nr:RNA methyltransferase [Methylophilus sp.]